MPPRSGETCVSAEGLVTEAQKNTAEAGTPEIRDTLIGAALSKVEHYEISSYGELVAGAEGMGQREVAELLRQEEQTAQKLESAAPQFLEKAIGAEE